MTLTDERPPQPERRTRSQRRPEIQGLRAIAVLTVVIFHAGLPMQGGFIGVDVFFVISGFVITGVIVREVQSAGRFKVGSFFVRRARRLLPALAAVSIFTAIVSAILLSPFGSQQQAAATGGSASIWVSNAVLYKITTSYFSVQVTENPFLHTWSLGVEEQFYLFFPIVVLLAVLISGGPKFLRTLGLLLALVGVLSFVGQLMIVGGMADSVIPNSRNFAFYLSPARAWEFSAGAVLAVNAHKLTKPSAVLRIAGLVVIFVGAFMISSTDVFPGWLALIPVTGTLLVLAGGTQGRGVLESKTFVWLGDVSYSWYLWHWPLIVFALRIFPESSIVAPSIAAIFSLGFAALSYKYVEQRFRRPVSRPSLKDLRFVAVGVAIPGALCGLLLIGSMQSWGNAQLASNAKQLIERPLRERTCLSDTPASKRVISECVWGAASQGAPIYLVGDSNAQMFTEGMVAAGKSLDRPVHVITMGGCAVSTAQVRVAVDYSQLRLCTAFNKDLVSWLADEPKGTVVMSAANESITDKDVALRMGSGPWVSEDKARKAKIWQQGTVGAIKAVEGAGQHAVLLKTVPHIDGGEARQWWHPVECSALVAYRDATDCAITETLAHVDERQRLAMASDVDAARLTGAELIDLTDELCPDAQCRTFREGIWVYRDGLHISPRQSEALAPAFARALS